MDIIKEAKRVINDEIMAMHQVCDNIDASFERAVGIIDKSNKVVVTGVGKSGSIARKIAATFSSIGVPSIFLHPVDALHGDIGQVQAGDSALFLSKSGSTVDIIKLMPYLVKRNIPIISIVGNKNSYLSRASDVTINASITKEACPLNQAPTSSTTVALAIGDALAVCLMKLRDFTPEDFSQFHPLGQIGRNTTVRAGDVMHKNNALPIVYEESDFKGALIEITEKGLGCVCVLNNSKELIGIITDGDVRRALQDNDNINTLKATDVMTSAPIRIKRDIFLGEAISIMENRESQISVLPVVDDQDKCIGVIRIHDIIKSGI